MDVYNSTQDQINQEMKAMHTKMKDPDVHEQKDLEDKQKKNVTRTTKRYGLN